MAPSSLPDGERDRLKRESFDTDRPVDLDAIRRTPVLVLDDLGAERLTAWAAEQLDGIVGVRYDRCLPMIATNNFTPAQLADAIAAAANNDGQTRARRIISSLTEGAQRIHFDTPDRRLTANRNAA